jgi:hypothetical protein
MIKNIEWLRNVLILLKIKILYICITIKLYFYHCKNSIFSNKYIILYKNISNKLIIFNSKPKEFIFQDNYSQNNLFLPLGLLISLSIFNFLVFHQPIFALKVNKNQQYAKVYHCLMCRTYKDLQTLALNFFRLPINYLFLAYNCWLTISSWSPRQMFSQLR